MSKLDDAINQIIEKKFAEEKERMWDELRARARHELYERNMTLAEAADYLHVSYQSVNRLVKTKEIPSFNLRYRVMVRLADVDAFIERQIEAGSGKDQETESRGHGELNGLALVEER